jgi:Ser/Thr protein kinase RdoA (MazF antagonist)
MNDPADGRPYADLTPHAVLDALALAGLHGDGRLLQLNSYENRVFQVFLEDGSVVVAKFYRPGRWSDAQIVEEHGFALELTAAEVPVVAPLVIDRTRADATLECLGAPPTLGRVGALRFAVTPRRAGRAPELDDADTLEWIGRFIGRLHTVGAARPFVGRRRIDADTLGWRPREWLLAHDTVSPGVRDRWARVSQRALELSTQALAAVEGLVTLRLHGDCHPGNLLWTPQGPHFVDLDDCATGPAVQDLWMLLPGDAASTHAALECLLEGYETFRVFDRRELGLIEPLRTLRMVHHSAWLAERWADPAFPAAFGWFGTEAYWAEQITQLQGQVEAIEDGDA